MPTASDELVTAKWKRLTFTQTALSNQYQVIAEVVVNVNGELVRTQTSYLWTTSVSFVPTLTDAIEDKRLEYVVAP